MKFSDLDFQPHTNYPDTGIAARHFFANGYGVSVVRFTSPFGFGGSYGAEEGLYEVAILKGLEENWEICYDTPITDDVIGYQSVEDIDNLLEQVESL
jgi:hypothetical protein